MRKLQQILFLILSLCFTSAQAQLYSAAYGDKTDPAILFLHGGPGYNSFSFEGSTADRLVEEGYYVIVFDQRGSGRSLNPEDSKYTFEEAVEDVRTIYQVFDINKATLIGHSWGGALGLMFAEKYPQMVKQLVLVSAPMDYPQTFEAILKNSKVAYEEKGMDEQLGYIAMLEKMDKSSLQFANYAFMHAMSSGLYSADNPAENSKEIKKKMLSLTDAKELRHMTQEPVKGYYDNEHYTSLVLYQRLMTLDRKVPVYGIYATEDGLFDERQLSDIKKAVGESDFTMVENASHSIFIDQQDDFVRVLKGYIK